jgi:hypothetical protein
VAGGADQHELLLAAAELLDERLDEKRRTALDRRHPLHVDDREVEPSGRSAARAGSAGRRPARARYKTATPRTLLPRASSGGEKTPMPS